MKLYGLTGGIGMGKSTSDKFLRDRGIPVVDTDTLAREIVEPGQPALAEIRASFGDHFISSDGRLRRDELAKHVFADAAARLRLEEILHPRIRALWQSQVETWRKESCARAVVVIPLLYETKVESAFHSIVCVACSASTQKQRLHARGWDADQIEKRIASQWPTETKMNLAQYVVWTEGDMESHAAQLQRIIP